MWVSERVEAEVGSLVLDARGYWEPVELLHEWLNVVVFLCFEDESAC